MFGGSGLNISLNLADKEKLDRQGMPGKLETRLEMWKYATVTLHVVAEVKNRDPLEFEEPEFHIEVLPYGASPEERTSYDLSISAERFKDLTRNFEGSFESRCSCDRVHIGYFGRTGK